MSILKNKSDENRLAAHILLDNNHFSPSVHCSYYSCIQLMKYILLKDGLTESELYEKQKISEQNLHEFLINHFFKELRSGNAFSQYRNTIGRLPELKQLRVDADYKAIEISDEDARKAIQLSNRITSDLKFLNRIQ